MYGNVEERMSLLWDALMKVSWYMFCCYSVKKNCFKFVIEYDRLYFLIRMIIYVCFSLYLEVGICFVAIRLRHK